MPRVLTEQEKRAFVLAGGDPAEIEQPDPILGAPLPPLPEPPPRPVAPPPAPPPDPMDQPSESELVAANPPGQAPQEQQMPQQQASPGGWVETSRQTQFTSGKPLGKSFYEGAAAQQVLGQTAVNLTRDAELEKNKAETQAALQRSYLDRIQADTMQQREAEYQEKRAEQVAKYMAAEEAVANTKIDPRGSFGKSAGNTIASALAMGLGAFASSITGTPNYAMQLIESAIQRDIDAQKENLMGKRRYAQYLKGNMDLSDMEKRRLDEFDAKMYIQKATSIQNMLKVNTAGAKNKEVLAKAADMDMQLQGNKMKAAQIIADSQGTSTSVAQAKFAPPIVPGQTAPDLRDEFPIERYNDIFWAGDTPVILPSTGAGTKVRESYKTAQDAIDVIKRVKALRKDALLAGSDTLNPVLHGQIEWAKTKLSEASGQGVITKDETPRWDKITGKSSHFFSPEGEKQLDEMIDVLDTSARRYIEKQSSKIPDTYKPPQRANIKLKSAVPGKEFAQEPIR